MSRISSWVVVTLLSVPICFGDTQWVRQAPTSLDRRWNGIFGIDANNAWVVGSRETVIETKDGGSSWIVHHTGSIDTNPFNAVAFSNPTTGFVAGNSDTTLFTATNGATWAKASGSNSAIAASFLDFVSPTNGFALYGGGVYKTTNSGLSWAIVPANLAINQYSADFRDDLVGLVGGDENQLGAGIFKTVDGGLTWTRKYPNAANALLWLSNITAIAIDQHTVLRSSDAGETWFQVGFIETPGVIRMSRFGTTDTLVATTPEGAIYRSNNLGQSWILVKPGLGQPFFPDRWAHIHCANSTVAWAVSDPGCIFRSLDQGLTWQQISNSGTVNITDLKMLDSNFGIAVGSPNYIMTTKDGGTSWKVSKHVNQEITATHEESLAVLDIVDANFAAAGGEGGTVFKTLNGGTSWLSVGYPLLDEQFEILALDFIDHNIGWVAGYDFSFGMHMNNLFKTTNGGQSWQPVLTNTEGQGFFQAGGFRDMFWIDANRGFLTGTIGEPKMIRTLDGGATWSNVVLPHVNGAYLNDIQFRSQTEGWIVGNLGYVVRSVNAGATWTKLNVGANLNGFNRVVFPGPNKVWLFGAEHFTQRPMLYKSQDSGATWTFEYLGNYPYVGQAATALDNGSVWFGTGMGTIHKAAHTVVAYVPSQMTILEGSLVSGSLASVTLSDNQYATVRRTAEPTLRSIQVELSTLANPAHTGPFILNIESRCIGTIATEVVELYDWHAQNWERVILFGPTSSDSNYDIPVTNNPARFIHSTSGEVKVRLTCRQEQLAFTSTWDYLIDEVKIQSDTVPVGFAPTSVNRIVGDAGTGTLTDVLTSNNTYLHAGFSWTVIRNSPNLIWEVLATAPLGTLSRLDLTVESKGSMDGLRQEIQLKDAVSGQWETVDTSLTMSVDSTRAISVPNAARFRGPGGQVTARISYKLVSPAGRTVTASLDYIRFHAHP